MRCRQIKPLISQCIDQTLPPLPAAQVERHLAECSACAAFHRELAGVVDLLRDSPPRRLSADFTAKVMQRMRAEQVPVTRRPVRRWWETLWLTPRRVAVGSLATVLVVVAIVFLRPRSDGPSPIGPEAQSFVAECMADYKLYASAQSAAVATPSLLGSWGDERKMQ